MLDCHCIDLWLLTSLDQIIDTVVYLKVLRTLCWINWRIQVYCHVLHRGYDTALADTVVHTIIDTMPDKIPV